MMLLLCLDEPQKCANAPSSDSIFSTMILRNVARPSIETGNLVLAVDVR
jgi:hypothetical protein